MEQESLNKLLLKHAISGFIFVSAAGTLLHFVYQWSGYNIAAGLIGAINESTWEHMKLMFIPMLIYASFLWLRFRNSVPSAFPAFTVGALIAVALIPVFYYTYKGILGFDITFLNLFTFYFSAFIGCAVFYCISKNYDLSGLNLIFFIVLNIILVLFLFFSIYQPDLGIFKIPVIH